MSNDVSLIIILPSSPLCSESAVIFGLLQFALLLDEGQVFPPELRPQKRLELFEVPDTGFVHRDLRLLRQHLGPEVLNLERKSCIGWHRCVKFLEHFWTFKIPASFLFFILFRIHLWVSYQLFKLYKLKKHGCCDWGYRMVGSGESTELLRYILHVYKRN